MSDKTELMELTDAELDAVSGGAGEGVITASSATIANGTFPNGLLGSSNPGFGTSTALGTSGGQNPVTMGQGVHTTSSGAVTNPGLGTLTH